MSLTHIYESFLKAPTVDALAEDANLNYITTLTTFQNAAQIVKHLNSQQKALKKKEEKVLSHIESHNAVCLDVETTMTFVTGGGAYLPNLDDNFLTDRTVTFPIIHIVHFNSNRKIQQIRQHWDQGSLLKLVDVIGSRAKNWPIRDGKDQIRLIKSSTAAVPVVESITKEMGGVTITANKTSPKKPNGASVIGDPHASLALFAPKDVSEQETSSFPAVVPRPSAKPPQRDYHDLFVGNESDLSPAGKAQSPLKENGSTMASKGGAGKNFQPSRLFDTDEEESVQGSPSKGKYLKPNPAKYSHFQFSDGSDEPKDTTPVKPRQKTKHDSQWDFEDFATPAKAASKPKSQDVRHFGWSDDEITDSPVKNPHVDKPRRDAETHFEFQDDGTPVAGHRPGAPRGHNASNSASGLYQNNVYDDESGSGLPIKSTSEADAAHFKDRKKDFAPHFDMTDSPQGRGERTASENQHANVKDRKKDFDVHWDMTDVPGLGEKSASETNKPLPEHRSKAVKMMNSQWEATDLSPVAKKQSGDLDKENVGFMHGQEKLATKIHTGGDGMGGRKGAERNWGFGDDSDEHSKPDTFHASKKQQAPKSEGLWDF